MQNENKTNLLTWWKSFRHFHKMPAWKAYAHARKQAQWLELIRANKVNRSKTSIWQIS